jgi:hypothetical protein
MTDRLRDERRRPFYTIDNDVIDKYGAQIGVYGIAVYNLIARHADAHGENAFPSLTTITKKLGIGRTKASETIQLLVDVGLIRKENRTDKDGDAAANLYTICHLGGGTQPVLPSTQPVLQVVPTEDYGSTQRVLYKDTKVAAQPLPPQADSEQPPPKQPTAHQQYFAKVCEIVGLDYRTLTADQTGKVAKTVGVLKDAEYTIEELNRFGRDVWVKDWRWTKKGQRPTLTELREEIGKLRAQDFGQVFIPNGGKVEFSLAGML